MNSTGQNKITVTANINLPVEKVWEYWTSPQHIVKWNNASDDWHTPWAENDLRTGGRFLSRMEARDGSMGFDFTGIYDNVILHKKITYSLADGRQVDVLFEPVDGITRLTEIFDPEQENAVEYQQAGWQAILNNFKQYAESK